MRQSQMLHASEGVSMILRARRAPMNAFHLFMQIPLSRGVWLLAFLFSLLTSSQIPAADAPQEFRDERGRLLYSIDSQGMVSMFENDALDNTVSVARGPRETMKPRITEISPPSVETGKITLVMLKGANLVGAKVTTRVPGISVKTEVPRANSLGVILRVDQAVKPGPVQFEITTPIGAVAATVTVVPAQAPVTPGKPKGDAVKPGKPESCPEGMVAIASAAGGFCIDMNRTQEGDWFFVEQACSYNFKRLCWAEEWEQACFENQKGAIVLRDLLGQWEWTRTSEYASGRERSGPVAEGEDWLAVIRGKDGCRSRDRKPPGDGTRPGRCCQ